MADSERTKWIRDPAQPFDDLAHIEVPHDASETDVAASRRHVFAEHALRAFAWLAGYDAGKLAEQIGVREAVYGREMVVRVETARIVERTMFAISDSEMKPPRYPSLE